MRIVIGVCLVLAVTAVGSAQSIDFEGPLYSPGALVGQDGWTCCAGGSDSTGFTVDNSVFSPMAGSTQSMKTIGVNSGNRVFKPLAANISTGVYRFGWDIRHTGDESKFGTVLLYTPAHANQIFQYLVSGGAVASLGNFYNSIGANAGDYANRDIFTGVLQKDTWYRVEFVIDFDQHIAVDYYLYDISTGTKVQIGYNGGGHWFRSTGSAWVGPFGEWGLRLDSTTAAQSMWVDNMTVEPATMPAPIVGATPLWANANVPFSKGVSLANPQPATWTLVSGPPGAVIDPTTGVITGWTPTASGTQNFTVKATNTYGAVSAPKTFTVTVIGQYELVNIPYNAQIDAGAGPAVTLVSQWSFLPPDDTTTDGFGRCLLPVGHGANDWFWNPPLVDFAKAGFGSSIDMSSCYTRMTVDLRYNKLNGLGDAPLAVVLYDTSGRSRGFDWFYTPQTGPVYPEWQHPTVYLNNWALSTWQLWWISDPAFDPTQVCRMAWFGTDWGGTGDDYFDVQHLVITNQPVTPVVAPVLPETQAAFVGTPYSKQVMVTPCTDVNWALAAVGTSATIDGNGLVGGWTPTAGQLGQTFTFTATATGPGGTASTTWHVRVKPTQIADSAPATPWGTIHANNFGTQSSDDPRMVLSKDWAVGVEVDWQLSLGSAGAARAASRSSIVFDADGNLYWRGVGDPCYLCSASPTGTLRWVSNASGEPLGLGIADTSSPVVGDGQRVYVATNDGVAAFNKADGDLVWTTSLPDCAYSNHGDRLTPVLHDGKLYAVSSGQPDKKVYQIDSLTGGVEWSSAFQVNIDTGWGELRGHMCLVPDALGAGIHGLYFNGDAGSAGLGMYCLAIAPASGATLQWSDRGGKVARSHVMYLPAIGRVCTHTWNDYGNSFYSWNLDGSEPATRLGGGGGHGFKDVGAVDFNSIDVVAGGPNGRFVRYGGANSWVAPTTPEEMIFSTDFENYSVGALSGQGPWVNGAGTTPPTVVTAPDPVEGAQSIRLQITDTQGEHSGIDLPISGLGLGYSDLVAAGYTMITVTYDIYRPAPLPAPPPPAGPYLAQNFWWWWFDSGTPTYGIQWDNAFEHAGGTVPFGWNDGTMSAPTVYGTWTPLVQVWDLPGHKATSYYNGKRLDAGTWVHDISTLTGWGFNLAHDNDTGTSGGPNLVYIDNFSIKGCKTGGGGGPTILGWYQTNSVFGENPGVGALYKNEAGKSIYVDGAISEQLTTRVIGFNVTDSVMYTTPPSGVDPSANEPLWFEYDTQGLNDAWDNPFTGGPLLGPVVPGTRQHIYFFDSGNSLVALTYLRPIPGDFDKDRMVDQEDLFIFLPCTPASGPTVTIADPNCVQCDLDGDQDIDQDDFGIFQRCFNPGYPGDPDCAK